MGVPIAEFEGQDCLKSSKEKKMSNDRRKILSVSLIALNILIGHAGASDLKEIMPVTNKILCLYFVDGHVDYGTFGSQATSSKAYQSPLTVAQVHTLTNYSLASPDDPNYSGPAHPVNAGRKSRGMDYVSLFSAVKLVLEHFVYIELPNPLRNGKTYRLSIDNLNADNVKNAEFVFNDRTLRSPAVHANQVGFAPAGPKIAYVSQWMGDFNTPVHVNGGLNLDSYAGVPFHVIRTEDGSVVFSGTLAKRTAQNAVETLSADFPIRNFSNADVWECDFTAFSTPGSYAVSVEGIGCSYPFEIHPDAYRHAYRSVSKAVFTQRQGVDKELEGGAVYPRDHHPDDRDVFYAGTRIKVDLWGWYHDAGDWDGYERHVRVPVDLMLLYDLKPDHFADGDVGNRYRLSAAGPWIEEGKNGIPDILDEAGWLVGFYRRGKEALIAVGKGDGGVPPGDIGPDAGCENLASWTDPRTTYVGAQNALTTYSYSAVSAYYSICLQKFFGTQTAETREWLNQATAAWDWAAAKGGSNHDEKMLAAVLLYRATGEAKYQSAFKSLYSPSMNGDYWQSPELPQYAVILYSLLPASTPGLETAFQTEVRGRVLASADRNFFEPGTSRGYRIPFSLYRYSGNGVLSTPRVLFLAAAHELTRDPKYLEFIYHFANYTLGGNQNNMVYVAQLGWNPDNNTFHPDSWRLIDYNHKVYTNPSLPGYLNYWGMTDGDWFNGVQYSFDDDEDWSRSTAYPAIRDWPAGEWRMNNRLSIPGSEFTMEECLTQALFAYGYLCDRSQGSLPDRRPVVALKADGNVPIRAPQDTLRLSVDASDNAYRVEYYYEWHYIGCSTDKANHFAVQWIPDLPAGNYLITAKAYNLKGLPTVPTPAGESLITVVRGASGVRPSGKAPLSFNLWQNYPNPFNPSTTIRYEIPEGGFVSLKVRNLLGRTVAVLVDQRQSPGLHSAVFKADRFASGVYRYTLELNHSIESKEMMLLR
jgi:endoglucanase